jgi:hypothetical protein
LIGRFFAGYLAPRRATAEHRITALVCEQASPTSVPGPRPPTASVVQLSQPTIPRAGRHSH